MSAKYLNNINYQCLTTYYSIVFAYNSFHNVSTLIKYLLTHLSISCALTKALMSFFRRESKAELVNQPAAENSSNANRNTVRI